MNRTGTDYTFNNLTGDFNLVIACVPGIQHVRQQLMNQP